MTDATEKPAPPDVQIVAAQPSEGEKALAQHATQMLKARKHVFIGRGIAAAIIATTGIGIIICVGAHALEAVTKAWAERVIFTDRGSAERLKYLIAFFSFKAAAFGGMLTAGLLLIKVANSLSGGDPKEDGGDAKGSE